MSTPSPQARWRILPAALCALSVACATTRSTLLGRIHLSTASASSGNHYDQSITTTNMTVDHVRLCVREVRGVVDRWTRNQDLSPLKDEPTDTSFLFHARSAKIPDRGFFRVTYDAYVDEGRADLSFWFVDLSGHEHDPTDFADLGTKVVLRELIEAANCSNANERLR